MPTTIESLTLAILFILPGYILGSVYNRNLAVPGPTDLQFVVRAIIFSIVDHIIASPWTERIYDYWTHGQGTLAQHAMEFVLWILVAVIVLPVILGLIFSRVVEAPRLQPFLERIGYSVDRRSLTCWDIIAQNPWGAWVIVGFKDGATIAGKFGRRSYISQTPSDNAIPRDVFLEEAWTSSDGNTFKHKVTNSKGVWIDGSEIRWIKFF